MSFIIMSQLTNDTRFMFDLCTLTCDYDSHLRLCWKQLQ